MPPAVLLSLMIHIATVSSHKIFSRELSAFFQRTPISPGCETALGADLDCPQLVQWLFRPDYRQSKISLSFDATPSYKSSRIVVRSRLTWAHLKD
jgi:hypothetical protein